MDFTDKNFVEILTALMATGNLRLILIAVFALGASIGILLTKWYYKEFYFYKKEKEVNQRKAKLERREKELNQRKAGLERRERKLNQLTVYQSVIKDSRNL